MYPVISSYQIVSRNAFIFFSSPCMQRNSISNDKLQVKGSLVHRIKLQNIFPLFGEDIPMVGPLHVLHVCILLEGARTHHFKNSPTTHLPTPSSYPSSLVSDSAPVSSQTWTRSRIQYRSQSGRPGPGFRTVFGFLESQSRIRSHFSSLLSLGFSIGFV